MDYERKYKLALERARQFIEHPLQEDSANIVEYIFPELKESEDERIRKTIIRFFKDNYPNETEMYDGSVTVGKALAWLEKQGEKKLTENTELQNYISNVTCLVNQSKKDFGL